MRLSRTIAGFALLHITCMTAYTADLLRGNSTILHQSELSRSISPDGRWEFFMKAPAPTREDDGPTMWIGRPHGGQAKLIGSLYRDGYMEWSPDSSCLLLLEEPSIEDARIRLYRLGGSGAEAVPTVDRGIRADVQGSIGRGSRVLFYALSTVGWLDSRHILIAAQARYVRQGVTAPAHTFTGGYVVDAESGRVVRGVSASDLKTRYGFSKRIV